MTSAEVPTVAAGLGVGQSTLWRWLSQDSSAGADGGDDAGDGVHGSGSPARRGYVLTEDDVKAFWRGNVAAAWRARVAAGVTDLPPLRTLQRALATQLTPGERAAVVDGVEGRRRHQVHLRWAPERRSVVPEAIGSTWR